MLTAAIVTVTHRILAPTDLVIIGIYFAIIFGIGFYFAKKGRTSEDYFLASRNIGWFAIGASLFVSNISTEHFIGLAGSGATSGLAVGDFEWLACMMLLLLGWVFVPFYLRSNVFTMPEFLERRFNRNCANYLATISVIAYIFTKISVHLYAAGIVLERVVGWNQWTAAIILVIATGVYTIAGGLAAVIYTDLVQTLILLAGAIALTLIGLDKVGGFAGLRAALPDSFFHMIKPASDPEFPWTGIVFGAPILGIWYWCTDQVIVQRVLSAQRRRSRQGRHNFCRLPESSSGFPVGSAGLNLLCAVPATVHRGGRQSYQRRHRFPYISNQSFAYRSGWIVDRGVAGRLDGRHELGF